MKSFFVISLLLLIVVLVAPEGTIDFDPPEAGEGTTDILEGVDNVVHSATNVNPGTQATLGPGVTAVIVGGMNIVTGAL